MFDSLSDRLRKTLAGLTGRGRVSEADVDAAMREVRLALLEADVNFKVVKDFVARVRERAVGAEILESLTAGQQVVKIVHEELTAILVRGRPDVPARRQPRAWSCWSASRARARRRSAAKLAKHVAKLGRQPLLVAADPYRPAAVDQLSTLAKQPAIRRSTARPAGRPPWTSPRRGVEHASAIGATSSSSTPPAASHRRRADGRAPRPSSAARARRDPARRRRDDRPGGGHGRAGVRRPRST